MFSLFLATVTIAPVLVVVTLLSRSVLKQYTSNPRVPVAIAALLALEGAGTLASLLGMEALTNGEDDDPLYLAGLGWTALAALVAVFAAPIGAIAAIVAYERRKSERLYSRCASGD